MDESLWPARNVAEYAYCPRLFYLMEVEGIHLPSDDTESGQRVHRRVDAPSAAPSGRERPPRRSDENTAESEGRPAVARSFTLTSQSLGLTATLDLAELSGQTAVPVEYRKGRPRRVYPPARSASEECSPHAPPEASHHAERDDYTGFEPWPTDRVQVALQSLLLEEAGYTVAECVIYYAAEKRRLTISFDAALRAEALATLAAARETATKPRPLPLVNDARCPRCSLQPICLPDEVNFERNVATSILLVDPAPVATSVPLVEASSANDPSLATNGEPLRPRSIWPPRDDGIHLVAQQNGSKVGVSGASLTVTDKDGKKLGEFPLANVESLSLLGSVQISTQAVGTLADRGIPIAYLSAAGRLTAMLDPLDSTSAQVRRAQVRRFDDPAACLELSRALVTAKIQNQRTLLLRNHESLPKRVAEDLAAQAAAAERAASLPSLLGHEGQAAALYFEHFAGMLKGDLSAEFDAHGRQRRPPPDPVNAALSFAYSMLTHECTAALRTARLEPSIGAMHVSRPGRPALALDLLEPFRPLLADSIVIAAFNRGELKVGHFLRTAAGCMFTEPGRKAFFSIYGRRLSDEVTHPVYGYKLSYRRMMILHARLIAAWLLGEVPSPAFLTTR